MDGPRSWELWDTPGIAHEVHRLWQNDPESLYRITMSYHISKFLRKGDTYLDVGCGSGFFYKWFRKFSDVDYTGVDTSEEMLAIARMAHPGVKFLKGDGYHLDFPDNAFEIVACVDVMQHVPDIVTMIRELKRVARRAIIFTLRIVDKTEKGWEDILKTRFLHYTYSLADAGIQIREATGGSPHRKFDLGYGNSRMWVVAKSTTIDIAPQF